MVVDRGINDQVGSRMEFFFFQLFFGSLKALIGQVKVLFVGAQATPFL